MIVFYYYFCLVQGSSDIEVFPENVAAAQLVYRCLGALPARLQSDVTASSTSPDGIYILSFYLDLINTFLLMILYQIPNK